jgi:hypothetical protein
VQKELIARLRDIYQDLGALEYAVGETIFGMLGLDGVLSKIDATIKFVEEGGE